MFSLPLGIICIIGIFALAFTQNSLSSYINYHSLLIVGGGTFAVLFLANTTSVLSKLTQEVLGLFKSEETTQVNFESLKKLTQDRKSKINSTDELTLYAQDLWNQGVDTDLFIVLLSQKRKDIEQRSVGSIQCLKNLAKYPPAFGMMGTVMGIVELFKNLEKNKSAIGPALALALTATFFGLAIANLIIMPVADRIQVRRMTMKKNLQTTYEVLLLINHNEPSSLITEELEQRAA